MYIYLAHTSVSCPLLIPISSLGEFQPTKLSDSSENLPPRSIWSASIIPTVADDCFVNLLKNTSSVWEEVIKRRVIQVFEDSSLSIRVTHHLSPSLTICVSKSENVSRGNGAGIYSKYLETRSLLFHKPDTPDIYH